MIKHLSVNSLQKNKVPYFLHIHNEEVIEFWSDTWSKWIITINPTWHIYTIYRVQPNEPFKVGDEVRHRICGEWSNRTYEVISSIIHNNNTYVVLSYPDGYLFVKSINMVKKADS